MLAKKLYTGSDHAGFDLRTRMVAHLRALGFEVDDLGTPSAESTDYPDWAAAVGRADLSGGRELVAVELEEVVGRRQQPPFRSNR